jgi:membrane-bound lytic murein transglycosylase D
MRTLGTSFLLLILGLVISQSGCGTSAQTTLPDLPVKHYPAGLVPPEYLYPAGGEERFDPKLVQEIQAFLEDSGILLGAPVDAASRLPIMINQPVKAYLRHFSGSNKKNFAVYLSRSGKYLPMMQRILQEYGLPPDLVYLALVESGFSPWARSPADAVGPWQFIEGTARRYGLKVDGAVDERRDPEKSTRAAARYLKDLYQQFGCWYLAAAGYNAGEKRVEGVVKRHQTRDFWVMADQKLLPHETRNYVPQLIAAALIARNPEKYGFAGVRYQRPMSYAQVRVPTGLNLRNAAAVLDLPYRELIELNPELNTEVTPGGPQGYLLKVPPQKKSQAAQRLGLGGAGGN